MEIHPEGDDLHSWRELECQKLHSVTAVGFCAVFTSLFFTYWLPTRLTFFAQKLTKITFILYVVWFAPGAKKIYISYIRII